MACYAVIPERHVHATAYADGFEDVGLVCDECIGVDDVERRKRLRARAEWLRVLAGDIEAWASGPINVVGADVLELERLFHEDVPVSVEGEAGRV